MAIVTIFELLRSLREQGNTTDVTTMTRFTLSPHATRLYVSRELFCDSCLDHIKPSYINTNPSHIISCAAECDINLKHIRPMLSSIFSPRVLLPRHNFQTHHLEPNFPQATRAQSLRLYCATSFLAGSLIRCVEADTDLRTILHDKTSKTP